MAVALRAWHKSRQVAIRSLLVAAAVPLALALVYLASQGNFAAMVVPVALLAAISVLWVVDSKYTCLDLSGDLLRLWSDGSWTEIRLDPSWDYVVPVGRRSLVSSPELVRDGTRIRLWQVAVAFDRPYGRGRDLDAIVDDIVRLTSE